MEQTHVHPTFARNWTIFTVILCGVTIGLLAARQTAAWCLAPFAAGAFGAWLVLWIQGDLDAI